MDVHSEQDGIKTTNRVLEQAQPLVRAIEALETIDKSGAFERTLVWILLKAYWHWLRMIVSLSPDWLAEEILSASLAMGSGRPAVWLSEK